MAEPKVSPTRGRPPRVSRAEVIAAGLRIARRGGFATLTMAALADELGVSAMTAYGYVSNKQELSQLIVDAVLAEVDVPEADAGNWAQRVALIERGARDALLQVRGSRQVVAAYGPTPHAIRLADALIAILREAGFSPVEATLAFDALFTFVTGQLGLDEAFSDPDHAQVDAPAAYHRPDNQRTADEIFDYGLAAILRGLQANLTNAVE
ncbi:TetR/AcrR family transcriptional regulator C-terminal domain-containing protein [Jatrophihabitans sp. DSM 45814]